MPAIIKPVHRIFRHNGRDIPDPNPTLPLREVQDILSAQYPELANAKARTENQEGTHVTTFNVSVGTNG